MNILIIEDNPSKAEDIIDAIIKTCDVTRENIKLAKCLVEARDYCTQNLFDIILLDLVLPNRLKEHPNPDYGKDFIYELNESKTLIKPLYIIGITAYEDTRTALRPEFNNMLWDIILYAPEQNGWKKTITQKISYLIEVKKREAVHEYDIGIVVAVQVELESFFKLPCKWVSFQRSGDSVTYYKTTWEDDGKKISVVLTKAPNMGMVPCATSTSKMINMFHPKYVFMGGILAGVKNTKIRLGDIVIAEQAWDYGSGKISVKDDERIFIPDSKPMVMDTVIRDQVLSLVDSSSFLKEIQTAWHGQKTEYNLSVKFGPVASGAAVVQDANIVGEITSHNRKLLGIDMETYALYYVANNINFPRSIPISIKSVSDFADAEKSDDMQDYAAFTSANYIRCLSLKLLDANLL